MIQLGADPTIRNYTAKVNLFELALNHSPNSRTDHKSLEYLFGEPFQRALERNTAKELLWGRGGGAALLTPNLPYNFVTWLLSPDILKRLDVDVNLIDDEGRTPLFHVRGIDEALMLLNAGANCTITSKKGISAARSLNRYFTLPRMVVIAFGRFF